MNRNYTSFGTKNTLSYTGRMHISRFERLLVWRVDYKNNVVGGHVVGRLSNLVGGRVVDPLEDEAFDTFVGTWSLQVQIGVFFVGQKILDFPKPTGILQEI